MNRKLLLTLLVASTAVIAGCTSPTNDDDDASHSGTTTGSSDALKQQSLALYNFKPIATTSDVNAHNTPGHVFLKLDEDHFQFLHFDNDDVTAAKNLLFVGDGFRGNFCVGPGGITKDQYAAGYVHFHSANAPNWDAGHNGANTDGAPTTNGWWFRHIGAMDGSMTMMGDTMTIKKGEVFPLMAAGIDNVKACETAGLGDKSALLSLYNYHPITTTNDVSPHNTPAHVFLQIDEDHFQFLHFNNDNVNEADGLLFVGDGFRGMRCVGDGGTTQAQYDAGYVHFHSANAPNWDAGHNGANTDGAPTTNGWWFRHIGATNMTMTMMGMDMQVEKGKVFPLMPADFATVQPCA